MKGLLLLSGGFDSPVAGHLMQQQGMELIAVHFSSEPFTTDEAEKKSVALAKKLGIVKIYVVHQGQLYSEIVKQCQHKYYYVITRRLMYKVAEKIAQEEHCDFLVTGENLAQVSSQTLENMSVINASVSMQVLRPLLCNDKQETIAIAKKIDTYELSKGPELCCALGPAHPATKSNLEIIEAEEQNIDVSVMVEKSLKTMKVVKL